MWEQIAEGRWRWRTSYRLPPLARSDLPTPYVISDEMPATEQVDGKWYTSKAKFRAVGRAHGLTEVGNEKPKRKTTRASQAPGEMEKRANSVRKAIAQYNNGRRVSTPMNGRRV
jgi:hypothetical protein